MGTTVHSNKQTEKTFYGFQAQHSFTDKSVLVWEQLFILTNTFLSIESSLLVIMLNLFSLHLFSSDKLDKMDANDNHTSPPPSNECWQEDDDEDRPQIKRAKVRMFCFSLCNSACIMAN